MIVYHWTTKDVANLIRKNGLRKGSWVCRQKNDWRGEVCIEISGLKVDWDLRESPANWQAVTHRRVGPDDIRIL